MQSIVRVFTICIVYMFSFQPVSPMKSGVMFIHNFCFTVGPHLDEHWVPLPSACIQLYFEIVVLRDIIA